MDGLPPSLKSRLRLSALSDVEAAKLNIAELEKMLQESRILVEEVDRKDSIFSSKGFPPASVASGDPSGRRMKRPNRHYDDDFGASPKLGQGGKRKRMPSSFKGEEGRIQAIQGKYAKKKKELLEKIAKMLMQISAKASYRNHMSWFLRPVDANYAPDYYRIITKPVDVTTIGNRVKLGHYPNVKSMYDDIKQMWTNCYLYNGADSPVRAAGEAMELVIDAEWKKQNYDSKWEDLDSQMEQELASAPPDWGEVADMDYETEEDVEDTPPARTKKAPKPPKAKPRADVEDVVDGKSHKTPGKKEILREMSYEEKADMINSLNDLPEEKMSHILNIVHLNKDRHRVDINADEEDDEIELDIEKLDNYTLWEIKRWVDKYMKSRKRSEAVKRKQKEARAAKREQEGGELGANSDDDSGTDNDEQVQ